MSNLLKRIGGRWLMYVLTAIAFAPLLAAQSTTGSAKVALYASVGEELIGFSVDVERATLTRQSSVMLPGFAQEAWAAPSTPFLYVAWSNGGASYNGTGVAGPGDRYGVTAFRIDPASGALRIQGAPASLRARRKGGPPAS